MKTKNCPECGHDLTTVLFMGVQPDFYSCPRCEMVYDLETLRPLAKIIGEEPPKGIFTLQPLNIPFLEIHQDEEPLHPREEFDNLGVLACWHKRLSLGDVNPQEPPDVWLKEHAPEGSVFLPVYLLDHGVRALSTTQDGFSAADPDKWDWGQLGWIVATPDAIRETFSLEDGQEITDEVKGHVKTILTNEIRMYHCFLNNEVWGYVFQQGGTQDSCWGFYGETLDETGLKEGVPDAAKPLLEKAWEIRQ